MHPSGTGSTTRMAKPSAPDQVVHVAIEITAPLMRFLSANRCCQDTVLDEK
jgi:hypothetical protein